jgi:hypothetical protein
MYRTGGAFNFFGAGTSAAPGIQIGETGSGWYLRTSGRLATQGGAAEFASGGLMFPSTSTISWNSTTLGSSVDTVMARAAANSLQFGASGTAGSATARTEINKAVSALADNTATATFTVTVPNAAHSASIMVLLTGSLGAGGTIGANEASASVGYNIAIARTAGVNAVATISAAFGSATSAAVAGAATCTVTGTLSAISGAVGATNTFTVNVTVARGSGTSTNHTCFAYAKLLNANATGVTIA